MPRLVSHRSRRDPFVRIERVVMEDPELSFKAKALYGYLLDKGDLPGWTTDIEKLCAIATDGAYAIRAALVELETAGFLVRTDTGGGGRGRRAEWNVYDEPKPAENREVYEPRLIAVTATTERENRDAAPIHRESLKKTKGGASAPSQRTLLNARARLIAVAVWERTDPHPAIGFTRVEQVARRFVADYTDEAVIDAMLAVPTISVGWVEGKLNGKSKQKGNDDFETAAAAYLRERT